MPQTTRTHKPLEIEPAQIQKLPSTTNYVLNSEFHFKNGEILLESLDICMTMKVDKYGILWAVYSEEGEGCLMKISYGASERIVCRLSIVSNPIGIAFSPAGDDSILIACHSTKKLVKFDRSKETEVEIGGLQSLGIGTPRYIDFDSQRNLYLLETSSAKEVKLLHKLSFDGGLDNVTSHVKLVQPFGGSSPCVVKVNRNDTVYTSSADPSVVRKIVNDRLVKEIKKVSTKTGEQLIRLASDMCIVDKYLFVVDEYDNYIRSIDMRTDTVETLDIKIEDVYCVAVDMINHVMYAGNPTTLFRFHFDYMGDKRLFKFPLPHKKFKDLVVKCQL